MKYVRMPSIKLMTIVPQGTIGSLLLTLYILLLIHIMMYDICLNAINYINGLSKFHFRNKINGASVNFGFRAFL